MAKEKTKRVFIALNLPQEAKSEALKIIKKLKQNHQGVSWVKTGGLHLTLHFLGELKKEQIKRVGLIMQTLTGKFKTFSFVWGGVKGFPNSNNPRVIFLSCRPINSSSVFKLQKLLGEKLIQAGLSVDKRPWKPHITLGRVKIAGHFRLKDDSSRPRTAFTINTFDLMESRLKPTGAEYVILEKFNLQSVNSGFQK